VFDAQSFGRIDLANLRLICVCSNQFQYIIHAWMNDMVHSDPKCLILLLDVFSGPACEGEPPWGCLLERREKYDGYFVMPNFGAPISFEAY
jgi:hypothetical protein